jgi:hypothetical protein
MLLATRMRMRVQLQEGGNTLSQTVVSEDAGGVTQRQLRDAMAELFHRVRGEITWFPRNDRLMMKAFGRAISEISREIKGFTGVGISQGQNVMRKRFVSSTGREFRLDIENVGGPNLVR